MAEIEKAYEGALQKNTELWRENQALGGTGRGIKGYLRDGAKALMGFVRYAKIRASAVYLHRNPQKEGLMKNQKLTRLGVLGIFLFCGLYFVSLGGGGCVPQCIDTDGDGYGDPANAECLFPELDCDDTDAEVNPGAIEGPWGDPSCSDGIDNDCSGTADDCAEDMVLIPTGEFVMGSDETDLDSLNDEYPEHVVNLSAYEIDLYEVTNQEFADFLNSYGSNVSPEGYQMHSTVYGHITPVGGTWWVDAGYEDHPVNWVTWYGANTFCDYYGKRLPTEAEWEKAARGGCEFGTDPEECDHQDERTYPWGEGIDCEHANYSPDYGIGDTCMGETTPVGSYTLGVSPYGPYDMAGNVWEWVHDWHDADYYDYSPAVDPQGPESGSDRVTRGGSWIIDSRYNRCASRVTSNPTDKYSNVGFRCAR